jgi:putative ATPase
MAPQRFYEPTERGFEARVRERLAFWAEKRREKATPTDGE